MQLFIATAASAKLLAEDFGVLLHPDYLEVAIVRLSGKVYKALYRHRSGGMKVRSFKDAEEFVSFRNRLIPTPKTAVDFTKPVAHVLNNQPEYVGKCSATIVKLNSTQPVRTCKVCVRSGRELVVHVIPYQDIAVGDRGNITQLINGTYLFMPSLRRHKQSGELYVRR